MPFEDYVEHIFAEQQRIRIQPVSCFGEQKQRVFHHMTSVLCFCDRQVSFQAALTLQVACMPPLYQIDLVLLTLFLNSGVIVHGAQLLFQFMCKMHKYNNCAEGKEHCNHAITFPTVCVIEFKMILGLWFLTIGR